MAPPRNRPASSSSSESSGGGVKARVLVDSYSWHDEHGNTDSEVHTAAKGDEITVSQKEYDRAQTMNPRGLAKASEKDPRTASDDVTFPHDLSEASDDELRALAAQVGADVDEDSPRDVLIAAVAAAPGGHERPQV